MRQLLFGFLIFASSGCVTTHYGQEYSSQKGDLVYSCAESHTVDHPYIKSISCAFENTGATWASVQVESFALRSNNQSDKLEVLTAEQIQSFLAAHRFEVEKNSYNSNMLLSGLIVVGAVAVLSGERSISNAGLATSVGAASAGATIGSIEEYRNAQGNRYEFSDNHILGPEFLIPPASFVRKTLLIQSIGSLVSKVSPQTIELCFIKPELQCAIMSFGNPRLRKQATR